MGGNFKTVVLYPLELDFLDALGASDRSVNAGYVDRLRQLEGGLNAIDWIAGGQE